MHVIRMNPEDLAKFDPQGKGEAGLRAALQDATELNARGLHKLITGVSLSPTSERTEKSEKS